MQTYVSVRTWTHNCKGETFNGRRPLICATNVLILATNHGFLNRKPNCEWLPVVTVILCDKQWINIKQLFSRCYYRNHLQDCERVDGL